MTIGTIMMDLSDPTSLQAVLAHVLPLARRTEAHVVGVHVGVRALAASGFDPYGVGGIADVRAIERRQAEADRALEQLGEDFRERLDREGIAGELLSLEEGGPTSLARACRNADMVVAPAWEGDRPGTAPESLALDCGRPVLVVPDRRRGEVEIGRRVVIGWNGSREAARAAFDALALLRTGADVRVVAVEGGQHEPGGGFQSGDTLARSMARHGHQVEAETRELSAGSVGSELLNVAADWGADMLAMGCYGHSRLREMVFGGAIRSILRQVSVPILLSH